jgi:hypothetical protein
MYIVGPLQPGTALPSLGDLELAAGIPGRRLWDPEDWQQAKDGLSQARWLTPVIPALGKLRQKDSKFEASLGHVAGLCLKKQNKTKNLPLTASLRYSCSPTELQ